MLLNYYIMKKIITIFTKGFFLLSLIFYFTASANISQTRKERKVIADCIDAKAAFISTDGLMKNLFNTAYSYVIFPNIGKGGFGIGGATGNGAVYRKGILIGMAKMSQLTIGFQAGGQSYREVIFFENERALNEFTDSKFEFTAQASAIIVAEGAAANVKYNNGVMIFTQPKAGFMYEASIGGQKFTYKAL